MKTNRTLIVRYIVTFGIDDSKLLSDKIADLVTEHAEWLYDHSGKLKGDGRIQINKGVIEWEMEEDFLDENKQNIDSPV